MISHLEAFRTHLRAKDRAELTVQGYLNDLQLFATWFEQTNGEPLTPAGITPTDIREYRQYLLVVERRKASTINRRISAISAYLEWALENEMIEHNPVEGVRGVPQAHPGPRYLARKEQYALQRAIEKDLQLAKLRYPKRWRARQRDASLVIFLLNTGLRLQEALALRLEDVELGERKGRVVVRQGKGGKQRVVPLNADARGALRAWLEVRPADTPKGFIWIAVESNTPGPLSSRSVQRVLQRYARAARLEQLSPHVLRHTFAKNLVDRGVGLEKVAALLGHASLNTTRIYVTPNQHDLEKAVETLNLE